MALLADFVSEYFRQLRRYSLLLGSVWVAVFLAASLEGFALEAVAALVAALAATAALDRLTARGRFASRPGSVTQQPNALGSVGAANSGANEGLLPAWRLLLDEREQSLAAMRRLLSPSAAWTAADPTGVR
ncbi:MAG TPA: hypothetical protein VNN21_03875 [Dehalococcoidia bacterium]|nr:hypothetical protein [Dehalococcoidia bacterium]